MGQVSEKELHEIVERVVRQTMGAGSDAGPSIPKSASPPQTTQQAQTETKPPSKLVVAIGADHGGFDLKEVLKKDIAEMGFELADVGANSKEPCDYPDFALAVAQLVSSGKAWRGIMIDGAGIGSCMVANKVPGVLAGMAYDVSTAINGREHNNANVLTLGAGLIGVNLAKQIVKTWLTTEFGGGRHAGRVNKILAVEKQFFK